jgi:hypothetical protein
MRHYNHVRTADGDSIETTFEHIPGTEMLHDLAAKVVVAYLAHDSDCENPMTSSDGQGVLEQEPRDVFRRLGLEDDFWLGGYNPVIDREFMLPSGVRTTLHQLIPDFDDEDEEHFHAACALYKQFWQHIVGPLVVPVEIGERYACVTTWDGDYNELPKALWVADKCVEENIRAALGDVEPTYESLHALAVEYAKGVLEEYEKWLEGDCYGCVVEVFDATKDEDYGTREFAAIDSEQDACWGHIGYEYAKETLRSAEFFDGAVKRIEKELTNEHV